MFLLLRSGHLAVAIYIQALALELITGMDSTIAVWMCGGVVTFYTVLGGMKAVIWTDVIQFFVTTGGIFVVLGTVLWTFGGNVSEIWRLCAHTGHTRLVVLNGSPFVETTLWWLILGTGLNELGAYSTDQVLVQRYLATKSRRDMVKAIALNGVLRIPQTIYLFCVGLGLTAYYMLHPALKASLEKLDQVLPNFIVNVLPMGVAGLVIAGMLAAIISTNSRITPSGLAVALLSDMMNTSQFTVKKGHGSVMNTRAVFAVMTLLAGSLVGSSPAGAAVVVLDNRTVGKVEFTIRRPDGKKSRHTLIPGDLTPIAATGPVGIAFDADGQPRRYVLQANSIYCFVRRDQKLDLSELALPAVEGTQSREVKPTQDHPRPAPPDSVYSVPVMLLVDDQEPTVRAVWEKRLRNRLAAASEIFEHHCRVRFQVVAVDTWVSNRDIHDFNRSVAEFEYKVRPAPARLAIGFTGRYQWVKGESHVGGIRGPLRSHILIREALVKVSEPERLEVLVHELGHFLGAVHSSEGTSVMRPALGDQQVCVRGFRVGFDAPNTLAMYLLGEELRTRPIFSLYELSPETKAPLRCVYASLAKAMPDDPAAPKYRTLLDLPTPVESQNGGPQN